VIFTASTRLINKKIPPPELSFGRFSKYDHPDKALSSANPPVWWAQYHVLNARFVGSSSWCYFSSVTKFGTCQGVCEGTEKARAASLFLLINTTTHWRKAWAMHVLASHCCMLLVLRGGGPGPNMAKMTPRTHVLTHRTRSLQRYMRSCWPGKDRLRPWCEV
jgi:hypothetical protein